MEPWLRTSLMLCSFGFFRKMRPSEPFAIEYLNNWFNMTSEQATKEVYPLSTYAVLAQLVIIFLITDMLRYKPIIVVSASAGMLLVGITIWAHTMLAFQIDQFFYGTYSASEVAYYTYMYAKVDKECYQMVTGQVRAAILCGKFSAAVLGQVLISTGATSIRTLFYISFGAQVVSFLIAVGLPSVPKSLYFYADQQKIGDKLNSDNTISDDKTKNNDNSKSDNKWLNGDRLKSEDSLSIAVINLQTPATVTTATNTPTIKALEAATSTALEPKFSWRNAGGLLIQHTVSAYKKPVVVKWSIWWAIASSAQALIVTYVQFLWLEIDPKHEKFYNGAVEGIVTLLGIVGSMAAGAMKSERHKKWQWLTMTLGSLLMGTFLIISALTTQINVAYVMYILFGMVFYYVITIASATVAKNLNDDSFGLIFGINTFFSLILQSLLAVFVLTDVGLGLRPREQYLVYGGFYVILASIFIVTATIKLFSKFKHKSKYILK